jgi:hypothetical protein
VCLLHINSCYIRPRLCAGGAIESEPIFSRTVYSILCPFMSFSVCSDLMLLISEVYHRAVNVAVICEMINFGRITSFW